MKSGRYVETDGPEYNEEERREVRMFFENTEDVEQNFNDIEMN